LQQESEKDGGDQRTVAENAYPEEDCRSERTASATAMRFATRKVKTMVCHAMPAAWA